MCHHKVRSNFLSTQRTASTTHEQSRPLPTFTFTNPHSIHSSSSEMHGPYISENLTLSLTPSSGWNSGLLLNMSVECEQWYNDSEANITTTNSLQSFLQLRKVTFGCTSLCNSIGNCSTSAALLTVDASAPLPLRLPSAAEPFCPMGVWLQVLLLCSISRTATNGGQALRSIVPLRMIGRASTSGATYPIGTLRLQTSGQPSHVSQQTTLETLDHRNVCCVQGRCSPKINSSNLPIDRVLTPGTSFNITCEDAFSVSMSAKFTHKG